MKNSIIKKYIILSVTLLLSLLSPILLAEEAPQAPTAAPQPEANPKPKNLFFCPPLEELQKDPVKLNWTAPNGWQSYDLSFIKKVQTYAGAQWTGADVGQMTCVYKGEDKNDFPILLVFNTLTMKPQGGKWSKNLGGYYNCLSENTNDCPFQIRLAPEKTNIYEEAEKLKKNESSEPKNPGF